MNCSACSGVTVLMALDALNIWYQNPIQTTPANQLNLGTSIQLKKLFIGCYYITNVFFSSLLRLKLVGEL